MVKHMDRAAFSWHTANNCKIMASKHERLFFRFLFLFFCFCLSAYKKFGKQQLSFLYALTLPPASLVSIRISQGYSSISSSVVSNLLHGSS